MPTADYLLLKDIVAEVQTYHRTHRGGARVAICMTGGGARGTYEAGVAEALLQALITAGIRPAILTGTSAGAMGMFADLLYSTFPPPPSRIYFGQQSVMWRKLCDGNNGAPLIAGDRAWVLRWLTKEERLTALDKFESSISALETAVNNLKKDMAKLKTDFSAVPKSTIVFSRDLTVRNANLSPVLAQFRSNIAQMNLHAQAINTAWGKVNILFPTRTLKAIRDFDAALTMFVADYGKTIFDVTTGVVSAEMATVVTGLDMLLKDTISFVTTLTSLLATLGADVAALVNDDLSFNGSMLEVIKASNDLIAFLRDRKDRVLNIAIVKNSHGEDVLTDHVFSNAPRHSLIQDFLQATYLSSGRPMAANLQRAILDDWFTRASQGDAVPELFLTAANITTPKLVVFAIASENTVGSLAKRGIWTVDLTSRAKLDLNILWPAPGVENQLIADAAVTSSAIPAAFPPVRWSLLLGDSPGHGTHIKQTLVDGGLLDNSPIDIAVAAGATHVLSIELTPLIDQGVYPVIDNGEYDAFTILFASFQTAMDGNLRSNIAAVVANNEGPTGEPIVQIYRLAPLVAGNFTPSTLNFDGVFDDNHQRKISLYDWFMQGYIDTKGLDAASLAGDTLVIDYKVGVVPSSRGYVGTARLGGRGVKMNKFWRASSQAWPTQLPT